MIRYYILFYFLFAFFGAIQAETAEEKGLMIATQAYQKNKGFVSQVASTELILMNAHGSQMNRKMVSKTLETATQGDKLLIEFLWPADVKGTKLLTWSYKNKDDDQWLYLPALNDTKRILSSRKSGSFMGSEFSYEDISSNEVDKYTYKFIDDGQLEGRDVWIYEQYPKDNRSGYSKRIIWMDKQYYQPLQIHYFDKKQELLKVSNFNNFVFDKGFWFYNHIAVKNVQTKKSSFLVWLDREVGVSLNTDYFLKQNINVR